MLWLVMNDESTKQLTLTIPTALYHTLRNEAYRQGVSLPDVIKSRVQLRPSTDAASFARLASLPLSEIMSRTEPSAVTSHPDACIDFYA